MEISAHCQIETKTLKEKGPNNGKLPKTSIVEFALTGLAKLFYYIFIMAIFAKAIQEIQVEAASYPSRYGQDLSETSSEIFQGQDNEGSGSAAEIFITRHARCRCLRKMKRFSRRRPAWAHVKTKKGNFDNFFKLISGNSYLLEFIYII